MMCTSPLVIAIDQGTTAHHFSQSKHHSVTIFIFLPNAKAVVDFQSMFLQIVHLTRRRCIQVRLHCAFISYTIHV